MRRLLSHSLSTMNCTPSAVNQFPSGLFSKELRQYGVIVLHFVISFYMFGALSIICHDYFVPAMERIAKGSFGFRFIVVNLSHWDTVNQHNVI